MCVCVCVCAVGSSSEWMNSVISMYIHTVYHPGFSYVCLDPWDLQVAYIHVYIYYQYQQQHGTIGLPSSLHE